MPSRRTGDETWREVLIQSDYARGDLNRGCVGGKAWDGDMPLAIERHCLEGGGLVVRSRGCSWGAGEELQLYVGRCADLGQTGLGCWILEAAGSRQGREGKGWEGGGGWGGSKTNRLVVTRTRGFMLARFVAVCKSEWVM